MDFTKKSLTFLLINIFESQTFKESRAIYTKRKNSKFVFFLLISKGAYIYNVKLITMECFWSFDLQIQIQKTSDYITLTKLYTDNKNLENHIVCDIL